MLFYTSKNGIGKVEATYNGRFAFICLRDAEEYESVQSLLKGNELKDLWRVNHSEDARNADRILAHEYTHKHIFSNSYTGLMLNGYRFLIRSLYLLFGLKKPVAAYYRMRTVYLQETQPYHEELAHSIDDLLSHGKTNMDKAFRDVVNNQFKHTITARESRIQTQWKNMRLYPSLPVRWLSFQLGRWLQKSFAIRVSYKEKDSTIYLSMSEKGVQNNMYTQYADDPVLIKSIKQLLFTLIVRPLARLETFEKHVDWYRIGQQAQFDTLSGTYRIGFKQFLMDIVHPSIQFIFEWTGVPLYLRSTLIEIYEDTLTMNPANFRSRWKATIDLWEQEPSLRTYFSFFHLHGN